MSKTGETKETGYGPATVYTTPADRPALEDNGPGLTRLVLDIPQELTGLAWIIGTDWEAMVTLHSGRDSFSSICGGIQDR